MNELKHLVFSPLEYDVHPFEWVGALLAEYKTLRENAVSAGVEITDDPDAECKMIAEVERFCKEASAMNMNLQIS